MSTLFVGMATTGMLGLASSSPGVCFIEGTKVLTETGYTDIEAIEIGKINAKDANILWSWAVEYGLDGYRNYHGPNFDSYLGGTMYHLKINGMHINILD